MTTFQNIPVAQATTSSIIEKYGLDFRISKHPMVAIDKGGNQIVSPFFGLINERTGEVINTCKAGYTVSQNEDVIDLVLKGIQQFQGDLSVSKAGSIHGGRRVFLQLALNGLTKIGNDSIVRYITVIDSNDGSTSLSIGIGDMAMHCQNQFFKFYKAGDSKFRHTASLEKRIQEIPRLIDNALNESMRQVATYNRFLSTPLTKQLADKMVNAVLGNDRSMSIAEQAKLSTRSINMMDTLYANIERETSEVGNNVWGLFNGLTRYTTHEIKGPSRDFGGDESLIVGNGYKKGIAGFKFLEAAI